MDGKTVFGAAGLAVVQVLLVNFWPEIIMLIYLVSWPSFLLLIFIGTQFQWTGSFDQPLTVATLLIFLFVNMLLLVRLVQQNGSSKKIIWLAGYLLAGIAIEFYLMGNLAATS